MGDYETRMADEDALQRKQQRFEAALRFATTHADSDDFFMDIEEAIEMADVLIAKLEAPTR